MEKALFFFEKTIADTSNGVILEQSWVQITVMVKNPLKIQGSYRAKNQSKEKTTRPKSKTVLHVIINSHLFIHKFERLFWLLICSIFFKKNVHQRTCFSTFTIVPICTKTLLGNQCHDMYWNPLANLKHFCLN